MKLKPIRIRKVVGFTVEMNAKITLPNTNNPDIDILVVGAGVAGSITGLVLSRLGYQVAVIERKPPGSHKIGECLPPRGLECLRMLDLEQAFLADNHLDMQGYSVSWDNDGVYERNFLTTPFGCGWLLNRERFDRMIRHAAQQSGCRYYWQTSLHRLDSNATQPAADKCWQVLCSTDDKYIEFCPKAIVDASGRSRSVARRMGSRSRRVDSLVACVSRVLHNNPDNSIPRDVLIESDKNGWWYSAPYSDQYSTLSYFTDGDMPLPENAMELLAWSKQAPQMKQRLKGARTPEQEQLIRTAAYSSALDNCTGARWIAVGDAACSFDPLSSYGIASAIGSGYYGGVALAEELKGKCGQLAVYQSLMQRTFLDFLELRNTEYQRVNQHDSPFWQRRVP
jgi:flavin-dependent dehydrogenase